MYLYVLSLYILPPHYTRSVLYTHSVSIFFLFFWFAHFWQHVVKDLLNQTTEYHGKTHMNTNLFMDLMNLYSFEKCIVEIVEFI